MDSTEHYTRTRTFIRCLELNRINVLKTPCQEFIYAYTYENFGSKRGHCMETFIPRMKQNVLLLIINYCLIFYFILFYFIAHGSVVVKVLCYKPEGRGFDIR
jgi:hypothetical protein